MGRAASHITLECALQTHPNITIIGEEVCSCLSTYYPKDSNLIDDCIRVHIRFTYPLKQLIYLNMPSTLVYIYSALIGKYRFAGICPETDVEECHRLHGRCYLQACWTWLQLRCHTDSRRSDRFYSRGMFPHWPLWSQLICFLVLTDDYFYLTTSQVQELIAELNEILANEVVDESGLWKKKLTEQSLKLFDLLPEAIQEQLMLERDPHGNVQVIDHSPASSY